MARNIAPDGGTVYRATITQTRADGTQWTKHEGPYDQLSTARGRATSWNGFTSRGDGAPATARVEEARIVWGPVGEGPAADQTALHDRIAAALYEQERPPREPAWADAYPADREVFEAMAAAVLAVLPAPVDQAAVLRDAADFFERTLEQSLDPESDPRYCTAVRDVVMGLRRRADEVQQPDDEGLSGPCDCGEGVVHYTTADCPFERRRRADEATATETQPEPIVERVKHSGPDTKFCVLCLSGEHERVDDEPAAETDEERADREETEREHARGDHTHCGLTCEVELPTEHLRNFVIAKGYPGTKGALAELERRAAAGARQDGVPRPGLRDRHRAAWKALTPEQQAARLAELDQDDEQQGGAQP